MRHRKNLLSVVVIGALVAASCGSDDDSGTTDTVAVTEETTADTAAASDDTVATETDSVPATEAPESTEPYAGEVGVTDDTIKIGFLIAETGQYAVATTETSKKMTEAAAQEVNDAGGINGRMVEIVEYDDGSGDPAVITQSFRQAKDEVFGVMSIIGNTATTLASLAEPDGVPAVVGNVDGNVARPTKYVFGAIPFWDTSSRLMDDYIVNDLAGADKPIGVVYMSTPNGEGAKDAFAEEAEAAGLNVVTTQPIDPFPSTCSNEVSKLQADGAEIVYMITATLPGACMLRAADEAGYAPTWTSPAYGWNLDLVAKFTGGLTDGIVSFGHQTTLETEAGQHYVETMQKYVPDAVVGTDITNDGMLTYSILQLYFEGLRAAGPNLTRDGFVAAMESDVTGFESGYLPPPTYNEGEHLGPLGVNLWVGSGGTGWVTEDPAWRDAF